MIRLAPKTVVPGHGELGTVELLQEFQDHLLFVRHEVDRRIKEGQTLDRIDQKGFQIIKERYQEWGNDRWIPLAIHSMYAEITGEPLIVPVF
jgi:hypothetical protein